MANIRQYIGARYIAKIYENSQDPESAEWEPNVNFEPLTIVTFNNGSYISKKNVPASVGNPPANPRYWSQTGFYNGQIASLQQQITAEIGNREDADEAINDRIDIIDPYEKFRNKTICVIGDSISAYTTVANNWVKLLTDFMANYDCTVINQANDGASFAGYANEIAAGTFTVASADYYIVFLGTNYSDDWGYTTGTYPLNPAVNTLCSAIRGAMNTDAKLFYVSPLKKFMPDVNTLKNPLSVMRNLLELMMQYQGYNVISGYNIGELNAVSKARYMTDNIHPTEAFSPILFKYILDGLVSERSNITQPSHDSRVYTNTISSNSAVTVRYDNLTILISLIVNNFTPAIGEWVDLMDMPTLLDDQPRPLASINEDAGKPIQYRISGGKLQAYFFSAPTNNSLSDLLTFEITAGQGC